MKSITELGARVLLRRFVSPADENIGESLAEFGPVETFHRILSGKTTRARYLQMGKINLEQELEKILYTTDLVGSKILIPENSNWPNKLNDLDFLMPICLWAWGDLDDALTKSKTISIVGSRASSAYGEQIAGQLGLLVAKSDGLTISGAAYGVDAAAHRGAISHNGKTVAVLACGIDIPYPAAHASLINRISKNGAVVSEMPPGTRPQRQNFLTRNRIIAALSDEVVVVEAAKRSGSLSTANWANSLGRKVWGVPGAIDSPTSIGVNLGIRNKSMEILVDANDLVEDMAA